MLLVESSKTWKRTHSVVSNSDLEKYIEAKKCDDFIFENRDIDDKLDKICLNRGNTYPFSMPKNQITKDEMKNRVLQLKNDVYEEPDTVWQGYRDIAHKYLDKVLNIIDEYRY